MNVTKQILIVDTSTTNGVLLHKVTNDFILSLCHSLVSDSLALQEQMIRDMILNEYCSPFTFNVKATPYFKRRKPISRKRLRHILKRKSL